MTKEYSWTTTIRCFTYNHSKYIVEALNGFTMQQTKFPYIILLVDDASTDGAQDVILSYINNQFDLEDKTVAYEKDEENYFLTYAQHKTNKNCFIATLYLKMNHHSNPQLKDKKMNYLTEWREKAKYEAICEGDDYWIDPLKLQKQVIFLEENPDFVLAHTGFNIFVQKTGNYIVNTRNAKKEETTESLLKCNTIATLTCVVRLKDYQNIPRDWLSIKTRMGDYPAWIELSRLGKIKYFPEKTAIYRVLNNSASHNSDVSVEFEFSKNALEIALFYAKKYDLFFDWDERFSKLITTYIFHSFVISNNVFCKKMIALAKENNYSIPFTAKLCYQITRLHCVNKTLSKAYLFIKNRIN